jgi:hypothetical protein
MRFQGVAAGLRALRLRELAPEDPIDSNVNRSKLSYEDLKSKDSIRILRL